MKTHIDLARNIYRENIIHYDWDNLPPRKKLVYIDLAEEVVLSLEKLLSPQEIHLQVVEVMQRDLKVGCCGG